MFVGLSAQTLSAKAVRLLLKIKEHRYIRKSGIRSLQSYFAFHTQSLTLGFPSSPSATPWQAQQSLFPIIFPSHLLIVSLFLHPGDRNLPDVRTPIAARTPAAIVEGGAVSGEMGSKLV
jgi:hypothetical protein